MLYIYINRFVRHSPNGRPVSEQSSYLENGHRCPQNVVEVLPITFTVRMLANDFRTSAFPFLSVVVGKLAKLTAEQIHAEYARVLCWFVVVNIYI